MFFKTRTVRDLKSNPRGTGIIRESLDFDDPSWIIEHHRHNLITKISKPKSSWFEGFRNLEQNLKSRLDLEYGRDHDQEISGENQQQNHNDGRPTTQSEHEGPNRNEQSYRVSLSELQRLHLRQLQHKLLNKVVDLRYDGMEPPGWADDLRQYGELNFTMNILQQN